ncbi:MAG: glutamate 5-kinase, partial [Candidatus Viridilinea halotolerans]
LNRPYMVGLARQVAALHADGIQVALVSSGAVAAGRERMSATPTQRNRANVPLRQMFAAVGQSRLMHLYEQLFDLYGLQVAQALLTRDDLRERRRYLNARNTLNLCLEHGIVPIINENDAVVTAEIRVGDNDNLSALVANLVDADLLIILTDIAGLYSADPRSDPAAQLIPEVPVIDERIWAIAGGAGSAQGTGGMRTKIEAADLATRAGATVVIAAGQTPDVILRLAAGEPIGTRFPAAASQLDARKRWILAETARQSRVVVDAGAVDALVYHGRSLLPAGISAVEGEFDRGQTVRIYAPDGHEIARGITQYRSADVRATRGLRSTQIAETLGYDYGPEIVHRDDMVVL